MPWTCKLCGHDVLSDDLACPRCQAAKAAWTMDGRTRTLKISGRKVVYLRGVDATPRPAEEPAWETLELVPAKEGLVLSRAEARALVERGQVPASRHVVVARLFPQKHPDWTVTVEAKFEHLESTEAKAAPPDDAQVGPEGFVDVRLVFVAGPDDGPLELPCGLTAVDVTEDGPLGHAPAASLRALQKPPRELPLRSVGALFVIAGVAPRALVRNCFVHMKPVEEGAAPARTFWVGAEGRAEPAGEGALVDGTRYALHWRYAEIDDPAAIPADEWQEVVAGLEVEVRPRWGRGALRLRLLRRGATPEAEPERQAGDEAEPTDADVARFRSEAPLREDEGGEPVQHDDETSPPVLEREAEEVVAGASYRLEGHGQTFEGVTDADGLILHEGVRLGPYRLEVEGQTFLVHAGHAGAGPLPVLVRPLVVPLFLIAGAAPRTLVRNCFVHVEPVEGSAQARTFWVGAEGKPEPEADGTLVRGMRYALHWRYGEIDDPAAIPADERHEVVAAPEVAVRPRRGRGTLHVRLLRRAAPPEGAGSGAGSGAGAGAGEADDVEPTDEQLARFKPSAPLRTEDDAAPAQRADAGPRPELVREEEEEVLAGAAYRLQGSEETFEGETDPDGRIVHEAAPFGPYRLEVEGRAFMVHTVRAGAGPLPVLVPLADAADGADAADATGGPAEAGEAPGAVSLADVEALRARYDDPLAQYRRTAAQEALS